MTEVILDPFLKHLYYSNPSKERRFKDLFYGHSTPYAFIHMELNPMDPLKTYRPIYIVGERQSGKTQHLLDVLKDHLQEDERHCAYVWESERECGDAHPIAQLDSVLRKRVYVVGDPGEIVKPTTAAEATRMAIFRFNNKGYVQEGIPAPSLVQTFYCKTYIELQLKEHYMAADERAGLEALEREGR